MAMLTRACSVGGINGVVVVAIGVVVASVVTATPALFGSKNSQCNYID